MNNGISVQKIPFLRTFNLIMFSGQKLLIRQFEEVDNAPLVLFRIFFGFLLFAEALGAIVTGWVDRTLMEPEFTFNLIGFDWIQPLPGYGMYYYYGIMALCGIAVMIGFYYRLSLSLFTVMWTLVYWMQKTHYNNHYYLLILLCVFMLIVPAHAYASMDANRKNAVVSLTCPRWCIDIFKIQLLIVFTYAALNKLYPGWLEGDFIRVMFNGKKNFWLIGPILQEAWLQKMVVYGGIIFDLLIIYLLWWKKTRLMALGLSFVFHLFNSAVFQIGIFPYLMLAICVLFFEPDAIRTRFFTKKPKVNIQRDLTQLTAMRKLVVTAFGVYFIIQILLPIRHLLYEGDAFYTEEGHRLSWRMMLRAKSGSCLIEVTHPESDSTWVVNNREFLTRGQARAMSGKPDMIWQFSQRLKEHYAKEGLSPVEIRVQSSVRLNGGQKHPLIDPEADLASVKWEPMKHSDWILSPNVE